MLASLRGVHFEMTRKCDISSTSLEGINENLLHLISGILFADNLRRQIGHFCKILVISEPLAIAQSFVESIARNYELLMIRGFKLAGYLNFKARFDGAD